MRRERADQGLGEVGLQHLLASRSTKRHLRSNASRFFGCECRCLFAAADRVDERADSSKRGEDGDKHVRIS
jgi:hypothetical protein